jgi:hypothetical protein
MLVEVYERDRFGDTHWNRRSCGSTRLSYTGRSSKYGWRRAVSLSSFVLVHSLFPFSSHCAIDYCYYDLFVLAIHLDLFVYTMSQDPDDPSASTPSLNFQTIFADALKHYKKRTKKDIAAHSLAAQIESCDSPNAVLTVLQTQVQTFDPSPNANERWTTLLGPTITVLYVFSGLLSNTAGPVNRGTLSLRPTL